MEKIATATYSFEKLRRAGYVYVDKTDMLWRLVSDTEDSQFFIARPRLAVERQPYRFHEI